MLQIQILIQQLFLLRALQSDRWRITEVSQHVFHSRRQTEIKMFWESVWNYQWNRLTFSVWWAPVPSFKCGDWISSLAQVAMCTIYSTMPTVFILQFDSLFCIIFLWILVAERQICSIAGPASQYATHRFIRLQSQLHFCLLLTYFPCYRAIQSEEGNYEFDISIS